MQEILKQHCLNQNSKGLLLLSMPTGFGKTHNVLNFIYENYKDFAEQKRKIFFITNLKKNLPYQKLKERFKVDSSEDEFNKHVLFIDSNAETVFENLLSVDSLIPEHFKTNNYTRLRSYIETLKSNGKMPKSVKTALKEEIRKILEPTFRQFISNQLRQEFKTKERRLDVIKNNSNYQWIGNLYPAVFTDERTVIFLSMDKFVRKNTTLVENSYYFQKRLVDKAVIFIDEFDATKENVLKSIIELGVRHRVDLLDLFLNIHNHLMENEYPEGMLRESEQRKRIVTEKNWPSPQVIVNNFQKQADHVFREYNLQHTCKSHEEFSSNKRNFLFYDYQFHNVLDARHKRIEIIPDTKNRTNWIKALEAETKGSGINIRSLLREITGFLTYFQRGIGYIAENYCQLKMENSSIQEVFPLDLAVKTILNHFRLDEYNIELLTDNIMERNIPYKSRLKISAIEEQGFYNTGFRYHDIVDSDEHDTLSKIYMYDFSKTPESFLVEICSQAMVVGISATAGLYTNIGNYDLEYLRSKLGSSFFRISGNSLERIKEKFSKDTRGYDQVFIKTEFIGKDDAEETLKLLQTMLDDREAALALRNKIRYSNPESKEEEIDQIFSRYVRALTAWKYFLEKSEIHAFLCFFNKFPKLSDPKFDLGTLYDYTEIIQSAYASVECEQVSDTVVILTGDEFDNNKAELLAALESGKRRFVISTYQTIGAGQNLQYPIPESKQPVKINGFPARTEMDFDAIYLDRPTNLLVNIFSDDLKDESFIKYLFQLEFLVENGAISPKVFESKLDEAFHLFVGRYRQKKGVENFTSLYQTEAYTRFLNKVVIQAIGRICRTNMKAPTIHILADSSIGKHLSRFSLPDDVIPVREYAALLKSSESIVKLSDYDELQNRGSNRSNRSAAFIYRLLKNPWTEDSAKLWQELREQVLKQPSISSKNDCDPKWNPIYVELPSPGYLYKYTQEKDYRDIEVFFSTDREAQEVSERAARLQELMAIEPLRRLFEEKGWATSFPKSELILTPIMFNNIYKGALGEVCGHYVLQEILGINLKELDISEFELFDLKAEKDIYIDFKLWSDHIAISADEVLPMIREKMERCNASRVFIINILGKSNVEFRPIISSDEKIVEIPFVCQGTSLNDKALKFIVEEFSK
jgi:DNA polymerase III delta prime subunit